MSVKSTIDNTTAKVDETRVGLSQFHFMVRNLGESAWR